MYFSHVCEVKMTVHVKSQAPGDQRPAGGYGAKENEMTDELYTRTESSVRYWTREELLIRAERAETRLAELEAATRWRPVIEKPVDDKPVLALMESGEYKVARYVVIGDINGVPLHHWSGTGGTSKHVAYWRPITEEAPAK